MADNSQSEFTEDVSDNSSDTDDQGSKELLLLISETVEDDTAGILTGVVEDVIIRFEKGDPAKLQSFFSIMKQLLLEYGSITDSKDRLRVMFVEFPDLQADIEEILESWEEDLAEKQSERVSCSTIDTARDQAMPNVPNLGTESDVPPQQITEQRDEISPERTDRLYAIIDRFQPQPQLSSALAKLVAEYNIRQKPYHYYCAELDTLFYDDPEASRELKSIFAAGEAQIKCGSGLTISLTTQATTFVDNMMKAPTIWDDSDGGWVRKARALTKLRALGRAKMPNATAHEIECLTGIINVTCNHDRRLVQHYVEVMTEILQKPKPNPNCKERLLAMFGTRSPIGLKVVRVIGVLTVGWFAGELKTRIAPVNADKVAQWQVALPCQLDDVPGRFVIPASAEEEAATGLLQMANGTFSSPACVTSVLRAAVRPILASAPSPSVPHPDAPADLPTDPKHVKTSDEEAYDSNGEKSLPTSGRLYAYSRRGGLASQVLDWSLPIAQRVDSGYVSANNIFNRFGQSGELGLDPPEPSPLAAKTFNVPELLELILLNLDAIDLLYCQAVNKLFRGFIADSKKLLQSLFLYNKPKSMHYWRVAEDDSEDVYTIEKIPKSLYGEEGYDYTRPVKLNTLLFDDRTTDNTLRAGIENAIFDLFSRSQSDSMIVFRTTAAVRCFSDVQNYHSCRDMYITNPPVKMVVLRFRFSIINYVGTSRIVNANGVTFGQLIDMVNERFGLDAVLLRPTMIDLERYALPTAEDWEEVESKPVYVAKRSW